MKLVNDIYELYKNQLTGDEEDAVIIVSGILAELDEGHMMDIIKDMSHSEMYEMLGTYLVDKLRSKLVQEGAGVPAQPLSDGVH